MAGQGSKIMLSSRLILLLFLSSIIWGCDAAPLLRVENMKNEDKVFFEVTLNTTEPSACSPIDPGANWRGILIKAPSQVPLSSEIFPLCGFYNLDMLALENSKPMTVVAIVKDTEQGYQGFIEDKDPSPDSPKPEMPPKDPSLYEGMAIGGYFNSDLRKYIKLPEQTAIYQVYIKYGDQQSNTVTVQVVK